ncbi:hypothetical protein WA158_000505 [Blastocystis sp. Blastoise]
MAPPPATGTETVSIAVGGEPAAAATLAPKVGPLGMAPKKVGDDIQKATMDWKGLKVTCKLTIVNRQATVEVVPSAASLLIKALNEPLRDRKATKGQVTNVAKALRHRSYAKEMSGSVKEILAIGCTVDGMTPQQVMQMIDNKEIEISA